MITINLDKAKAITKDRLRSERAPLLAKLDVEFIKAVEQGADTSSIVAEKQRLRDITALTETVSSLDDLKSLSASDAPSAAV
jgi:hypothetical protein